MIIKKFQANNETDAIMMAKEEMGSSAVVLNIKTIKHRGLAKLFKKDIVEVTAALEERQPTDKIPVKQIDTTVQKMNLENNIQEEKKTTAIEEKLNNLQSMLENQMHSVEKKTVNEDEKEEKPKSINFTFLQLIYSQLLDNEVDEKYANEIIGEVEAALKKEANVDSLLSGIYQKIVLKLGTPRLIELEEKKTKLVFFIGPTGVGKTTTIAKLASYYKLEKKARVAMITSDTYRIAAVEQLRTYANILDVPLQVIYTIEELNNAIKMFEGYDIVLVDTAGRSHKNNEQCHEMIHLIRDCEIDDEKVSKQIYLVLSVATKYKDLIRIADAFGEVKDYGIIFTKLDETSCLGSILNMKLKTGMQLSYITSGQTVPDDISTIDAQMIARNLLGGGE